MALGVENPNAGRAYSKNAGLTSPQARQMAAERPTRAYKARDGSTRYGIAPRQENASQRRRGAQRGNGHGGPCPAARDRAAEDPHLGWRPGAEDAV